MDRAIQQLAEADRRRIQASVEVEALLTLRHQQWEEYREAQLRAGQRELDELGLWRWLAARGKEEEV